MLVGEWPGRQELRGESSTREKLSERSLDTTVARGWTSRQTHPTPTNTSDHSTESTPLTQDNERLHTDGKVCACRQTGSTYRQYTYTKSQCSSAKTRHQHKEGKKLTIFEKTPGPPLEVSMSSESSSRFCCCEISGIFFSLMLSAPPRPPPPPLPPVFFPPPAMLLDQKRDRKSRLDELGLRLRQSVPR